MGLKMGLIGGLRGEMGGKEVSKEILCEDKYNWTFRKERLRGTRGSPIGSDDGVAADVDAFGFGLAANFGKGRPVLLFLKNSAHSLLFVDLFLYNPVLFFIYRTLWEAVILKS